MLAVLVARGDRAAFAALVDRYSVRVFRVAVRILGDAAEAEDVTQEVFATAWGRLGDLADPAAVRTWLFRVTERHCLGVLRTRRCVVVPSVPEQRCASSDDPQHLVEAAATVTALHAAVSTLPPTQRAVWFLAEVEGLSYAQIATTLTTSEESVRGRLCRARGRLADAMRSWR
ncbi:sigma-70 family RNA polymerase sigma factor [Actinosynnema sp. NPDC020468]|uniref:RNA polymerase sigma factor n=1 Tax=Actinosynnema sp. NPDC020468 TaxID=3154488 RepID=UPI0033ED5F35